MAALLLRRSYGRSLPGSFLLSYGGDGSRRLRSSLAADVGLKDHQAASAQEVEATSQDSETEVDELIKEAPRRRSRFAYTRMLLDDFPELKEPKAIKLLKKLGLDAFVRARVPKTDKQSCDEFLSSYVHGIDESHGTVRGKVVRVTPEAVHKVTGLPLGNQPFLRLRRDQINAMKQLGRRVQSNAFDVKSVKLGNNGEESEVLVVIARLLMQKMCMTHIKGTVAGRVLWGLRESCLGGGEPEWAAYMAELMRTNASLMQEPGVKTKRFRYGRWLTGIIRNQEKNQQEAEEEGSLDKDLQRELDWKERELKMKEEDLMNRERNLRRMLTRCSKFAETL